MIRFSCEKALLLSAVTTASRAAAAKSAVPTLEGLLIEAESDKVRISGYDLKTGITASFNADVMESGSIVLNAKLFGDIIRKMPDDIVTVDTDDALMTIITCSVSKYQIVGTQSEDYPELPLVDCQNSVSVQEKTLKAMISQTNFAVSDNDARPIHTGTLFEIEEGVLTMVAVDGYRLALRREKISEEKKDSFSFVVPGSALSEVEKIASDSEEQIQITLGTKHIMFTIGDTTLISRRLEGEFLNYKNSIPQSGKYNIKASRRAVIESVERVSLIISDKLKSPVRCTFTDGILQLATMTALGKASDECPVEGNGENLEIGFNNKYLLDAFKAAPADSVVMQLTTSVTPCVIVPPGDDDSFLYMILPVRLRANES